MPRYLLLDAEWLDREIHNAEMLREHAAGTGKSVAIAAASVRAESLKEIRRLAVETLPPGEGPIALSIAAPPRGEEDRERERERFVWRVVDAAEPREDGGRERVDTQEHGYI
jgi:hypothetical protein